MLADIVLKRAVIVAEIGQRNFRPGRPCRSALRDFNGCHCGDYSSQTRPGQVTGVPLQACPPLAPLKIMFLAKAETASSTGSVLAIEDEVNRDLCFHFQGFSIQIIGPVFPLPHCIIGCMRKHWMTADDFGPLDHS